MTMRQYRQQSKLKNNFLLQTSPYIYILSSNHILYGRRRGRRRHYLVTLSLLPPDSPLPAGPIH